MEHVLLKAATETINDQGEFDAVISSASVDREKDVVSPTGMLRAIRRWIPVGKKIPLAWQHSTAAADQIGWIDPKSAHIVGHEVHAKGWIDQATDTGKHAWRCVKSGTLGFSFGYLTQASSPRKGGGRNLDEFDVFEITATQVPMNNDTRVLGWKGENAPAVEPDPAGLRAHANQLEREIAEDSLAEGSLAEDSPPEPDPLPPAPDPSEAAPDAPEGPPEPEPPETVEQWERAVKAERETVSEEREAEARQLPETPPEPEPDPEPESEVKVVAASPEPPETVEQWERAVAVERSDTAARRRSHEDRLFDIEEKASADVGAHARDKLKYLIAYYMKKPHPFTECVRDNAKRFGPHGADQVCATLKDIGEGTTHWRNQPGKAFTSSAHPRAAAGTATGGQFIAASGGGTHDQAAAGAAKLLGGKLTVERIKRYQTAHNLQVDGKIGAQTAASLLGDKNASKIKPGVMTDAQRRRLASHKALDATGVIPDATDTDEPDWPQILMDAASGNLEGLVEMWHQYMAANGDDPADHDPDDTPAPMKSRPPDVQRVDAERYSREAAREDRDEREKALPATSRPLPEDPIRIPVTVVPPESTRQRKRASRVEREMEIGQPPAAAVDPSPITDDNLDEVAVALIAGSDFPTQIKDRLTLAAKALLAQEAEQQAESEALDAEPRTGSGDLRSRADAVALEYLSGGASLKKPPRVKAVQPPELLPLGELRQRMRDEMLTALSGVTKEQE